MGKVLALKKNSKEFKDLKGFMIPIKPVQVLEELLSLRSSGFLEKVSRSLEKEELNEKVYTKKQERTKKLDRKP